MKTSVRGIVLAPYAVPWFSTRGRRYVEEEHDYRSPFQRDRDRLIHSSSFRRLMYKTQVLVNDFSDHHRTRLTHTLEVAQISRTIARELDLNEDLTEAIALSHDLGHPPFGHAGETALAQCMAAHGGFEHNRFGLKLVEELEQRYPYFPGLNLTWEVRVAMAYHSKQPQAPEVALYREPGMLQPFLEAQVVDMADSLAYDTHDLDDALNLGLMSLEGLKDVPLWCRAAKQAEQRYGRLEKPFLQAAVVRTLIDWQVNDLIQTTRAALSQTPMHSSQDVQAHAHPFVQISQELQEWKTDLEKFLHREVYRHDSVERMTAKAHRMITALFQEFMAHPGMLPKPYRLAVDRQGIAATVCDYLASLTDRTAQIEFIKLFHPH